MKIHQTLKYIGRYFVSVLLLSTVLACDKQDLPEIETPVNPSEIKIKVIVGAWSDNERTYPEYYVFNSDMTGKLVETDRDGHYEDETDFTWELNDGCITLISDYEKIRMTVTECTYRKLVLECAGETLTLYSVSMSDVPSESSPDDKGPSKVTTGGAAPMAFRATLYGKVTGDKAPDEVGFEYCYNRDFRRTETGRVAVDGMIGDLELEATFLIDDMTIYYRAFQTTDGKTSYGEIKDFHTAEGTYTLGGRTYKFVKVDGGPNGSFSIMQTELTPNAILEIDGREIGVLDANNDGTVSRSETRDLYNKMNMILRVPTPSEWVFVASGGMKGHSYTYSGGNDLNLVGWYSANAQGSWRRPAQKAPNELGMYDMSGNLAEIVRNYPPEMLVDMKEAINSFSTNISATWFDTMWAGNMACGGNWTSDEDECTVYSTEKEILNKNNMNTFNGQKYCFRFAYSRPDVNGEPTVPMQIITGDAQPEAYRATLYGSFTGNRAPQEVGFEYSYYPDFKKNYTAVVSSPDIAGYFHMDAVNLVDQIEVYYRAFAVCDGVRYYGETKSFETRQGTYTMNGKTYRFIKVTGLPTGSFSIMETELLPQAEFAIEGDEKISIADKNNDGSISRDEMRWLTSRNGVYLRWPSATEWLFAARGGSLGKGYTYSGGNDIDDVAWYSGNSQGGPHAPCLKAPNELGLYDMTGNYSEVCGGYNDDQLLDIRDITCKFPNIKDYSAWMFDVMWEGKDGARGGNWNSSASGCTVESSIPSETGNSFLNNTYRAFRFVYSRPD